MPTPRRSGRNHPRIPSPNAFRSCSSCGSRNSIRRRLCTSCGSAFSKRKPSRGLTNRRRQGQRSGAMSAGGSESIDTSLDTSIDSQETMANTPEEGSAASSPHSTVPHPSQLTEEGSPPSQESLTTADVSDKSSIVPGISPKSPQAAVSSPPPLHPIPDSPSNDNPSSPLSSQTQVRSTYQTSGSLNEPQDVDYSQTAACIAAPPASQGTHTLTPPPLPDFMQALNMKLARTSDMSSKTQTSSPSNEVAEPSGFIKTYSQSSVENIINSTTKELPEQEQIEKTKTGKTSKGTRVRGLKKDEERLLEDEKEEKMDTDTDSKSDDESTLMKRFKKDPGAVLDLLKSALSMDKLTQLLSTEYHSNTKQLEQLQSRLEAAYHTLKDCAEHKAGLTKTIEETNDKIKRKRKHLEVLRGDLKVLGEEELQLKKRRDTAYSRCVNLKQKLKASRDALQQISVLAPGRIETEPVQTRDTN